MSKYGVISSPYFPVFGLNMEIYFVNLCMQSKYVKIRIRNNSVFGQCESFWEIKEFHHMHKGIRSYQFEGVHEVILDTDFILLFRPKK